MTLITLKPIHANIQSSKKNKMIKIKSCRLRSGALVNVHVEPQNGENPHKMLIQNTMNVTKDTLFDVKSN